MDGRWLNVRWVASAHANTKYITTSKPLLPQVSLLNEPNTSSPANVDASVMYRRWKDSKGKDKEYENIIR